MYRGIRLSETEIAEEFKDFYTAKGFLSTSICLAVAEKFAFSLPKSDPESEDKDPCVLVIENGKGTPISKYSTIKEEVEVLMKPMTKF